MGVGGRKDVPMRGLGLGKCEGIGMRAKRKDNKADVKEHLVGDEDITGLAKLVAKEPAKEEFAARKVVDASGKEVGDVEETEEVEEEDLSTWLARMEVGRRERRRREAERRQLYLQYRCLVGLPLGRTPPSSLPPPSSLYTSSSLPPPSSLLTPTSLPLDSDWVPRVRQPGRSVPPENLDLPHFEQMSNFASCRSKFYDF